MTKPISAKTSDACSAIQLRQMQIYSAMLTGEKQAIPLPVAELEAAAAKMLKP